MVIAHLGREARSTPSKEAVVVEALSVERLVIDGSGVFRAVRFGSIRGCAPLDGRRVEGWGICTMGGVRSLLEGVVEIAQPLRCRLPPPTIAHSAAVDREGRTDTMQAVHLALDLAHAFAQAKALRGAHSGKVGRPPSGHQEGGMWCVLDLARAFESAPLEREGAVLGVDDVDGARRLGGDYHLPSMTISRSQWRGQRGGLWKATTTISYVSVQRLPYERSCARTSAPPSVHALPIRSQVWSVTLVGRPAIAQISPTCMTEKSDV